MEFVNPKDFAFIMPTGVTSIESLAFEKSAAHVFCYETETVFHAPSENFRATFRQRTGFD